MVKRQILTSWRFMKFLAELVFDKHTRRVITSILARTDKDLEKKREGKGDSLRSPNDHPHDTEILIKLHCRRYGRGCFKRDVHRNGGEVVSEDLKRYVQLPMLTSRS